MNVRTAIQAETVEEMTELGTAIEVTDLVGEIEMIGVCLEGMLGVMIMTVHQEETATFLKDEWIEEAGDEGLPEVIEMSLRSR